MSGYNVKPVNNKDGSLTQIVEVKLQLVASEEALGMASISGKTVMVAIEESQRELQLLEALTKAAEGESAERPE